MTHVSSVWHIHTADRSNCWLGQEVPHLAEVAKVLHSSNDVLNICNTQPVVTWSVPPLGQQYIMHDYDSMHMAFVCIYSVYIHVHRKHLHVLLMQSVCVSTHVT